ncbi:MAG: benzoate-CoA ligase family protein [Burkholderiaceae bacterium]|nr:benzoate-CoA ligase family protein [Burkholderiaceae bacterium]
MNQLSSADHRASPPRIEIPANYNAAVDLIGRNLAAGRADKVAFVDDAGSCTYGELAQRVELFASGLAALGLRREERVMICMHDSIDWPVAFLGAIKAGIVPVAANTLLMAKDYEFMVRDSRARAVIVSNPLLANFTALLDAVPTLEHIVVAGVASGESGARMRFEDVIAAGHQPFAGPDTSPDEPCFWLYSSGSTGTPKGTVHIHSSMIQTAELYARPVLGIRESDRVFSAAKLFFAYGLGNGLTFPMAVGATAILMAERPTPAAVFGKLTGAHQPTIFYGVPTLFAGLLADPAFPERSAMQLRVATSAGEALPAQIGERWRERTGVDILDGIGSTEMLHIFLSNRPGEVRYGTTGMAVPGYELRLLGDNGEPVADGEVGDLFVKGPSAASGYWNQREKTRAVFRGEWTHSGDKYVRSEDGYYTYSGRSDDMLKVSGQYVSPFEVESALATHPKVLEAAVVGYPDADELIKPRAFVVLKNPSDASDQLADELRTYVRSQLAPHKYPRWIEFTAELPKTATGKIQRFRLRG